MDKLDQALYSKLQHHYSIKTIAEMYDLSENTIRKWIQQRKLKAHKINGAVRVPKSELLKIVRDWTIY